jgi:hypothetical protein
MSADTGAGALEAAIRWAVVLLESGRAHEARDLLRSVVACPPPTFDAPSRPGGGEAS